MPHFTSQEQLKAYLNADQVTALFAKIPTAEQEKHFAYADALITNATGIAPQNDNNPIQLESIAARIVIWLLSGIQQWNDQNRPELDRRETFYRDALDELQKIASGEITIAPAAEKIISTCGANERRIGAW